MSRKIGSYLFYIVVCLLAALLSSFLAGDSSAAYQNLPKPPLAPPDWVFPVVWTLLYALMGFGAARVKLAGGGLALFWLQLIINICWPVIFFRFGLCWLAYFWLIALLILVLVMVWRWFDHDKLAAWLQLPYVVWLTFASYLNLGICLLLS